METLAADEFQASVESRLFDTNPDDNTMHLIGPALSCFCIKEKRNNSLDLLLEFT